MWKIQTNRGDTMKAIVKDDILHLELPLEKGKRSKSGKTWVVFTTQGFIDIVDTGLKISINVISNKQLTP